MNNGTACELRFFAYRIMKRIGSGHFGTVSKGVWYSGEEPKEVAVKTVKTSTEQERIKLLQEAAIMGQFAHNNVVRLHGVVTVGEPVSMHYIFGSFIELTGSKGVSITIMHVEQVTIATNFLVLILWVQEVTEDH